MPARSAVLFVIMLRNLLSRNHVATSKPSAQVDLTTAGRTEGAVIGYGPAATYRAAVWQGFRVLGHSPISSLPIGRVASGSRMRGCLVASVYSSRAPEHSRSATITAGQARSRNLARGVPAALRAALRRAAKPCVSGESGAPSTSCRGGPTLVRTISIRPSPVMPTTRVSGSTAARNPGMKAARALDDIPARSSRMGPASWRSRICRATSLSAVWLSRRCASRSRPAALPASRSNAVRAGVGCTSSRPPPRRGTSWEIAVSSSASIASSNTGSRTSATRSAPMAVRNCGANPSASVRRVAFA